MIERQEMCSRRPVPVPAPAPVPADPVATQQISRRESPSSRCPVGRSSAVSRLSSLLVLSTIYQHRYHQTDSVQIRPDLQTKKYFSYDCALNSQSPTAHLHGSDYLMKMSTSYCLSLSRYLFLIHAKSPLNASWRIL